MLGQERGVEAERFGGSRQVEGLLVGQSFLDFDRQTQPHGGSGVDGEHTVDGDPRPGGDVLVEFDARREVAQRIADFG